ncbi:Alpha/Beta hydrolase protein [Cercophora scortea]|uniref:Alpha/Beta hydrolase protein n=1 Tax=Cercophora scortea TaxID=314031 RepID=A0AAE0I377_9PEZI|nr:Alpha/Beta hydrolase protein [Cercophora scortea]
MTLVPAEKLKSRSFSEKLFRRTSSASLADPNPWGIRVLHNPPDARVDVIFVHGIRGHLENTWAQGEGGPPWPRTLLPRRLPEARILTFGYDANPIAFRLSVSGNKIGDHAKNLLSAVAAQRLSAATSNRPILFVAHSLGGLVCKDALLTAKSSPEEHLRRIFECTSGILFLGTPHSGSSLATVAQRLATLLSFSTPKTNLRILKVLQRDSEVLARIQNEFFALLQSRNKDSGARPLQVVCFYEELPYPGIGDPIVPTESAVLPGHIGIGIHAHHRDMVRFASDKAPGFESVVAELQRLVKGIPSLAERAVVPLPDGSTGIQTCQSQIVSAKSSSSDYAGVRIWGGVVGSNIVSGNQTIYGDLKFSG